MRHRDPNGLREWGCGAYGLWLTPPGLAFLQEAMRDSFRSTRSHFESRSTDGLPSLWNTCSSQQTTLHWLQAPSQGCAVYTADTGTNANRHTRLLLQMMVALDATKGIMRALDLHPVLALSGPNYGPNMGTDVLLR